MWKLLITVLSLISLSSAQNPSLVSFSLFASNLNGCDALSDCDAFVKILCSSASEDWHQCGSTSKIQDDNNPKWPEVFNFVHDRSFWRFDVVDADALVDDPIGSFSINVDDFLSATSKSQPNLAVDLNGRGTLTLHQIFEFKA